MDRFFWIATSLCSSQGIVAWINSTAVIPRLDCGIQLKIKLLVFFIVFMDPVVKPRGDTVDFTGPRNKSKAGMT
ncbi:RPE4 domain protein [Rickettsia argasii T170-B]|uniref:RPE4 domain protein n=1 Tax=Rickettsia argasii T170-B TaxID=1268837 RepID=A0A0F3RJC1_9RICK|nr:RPE4 domain protein [Rickettsia argasii T170-B]